MESITIILNDLWSSLLGHLDSRDVALWVTRSAAETEPQCLARALTLPWKLVILESASPALLEAITAPETPDDPKVRRRGYPILIDVNPAEIVLPRRSLPIYRLYDATTTAAHTLGAQLRRLNILDALQKAAPKELVILSGDGPGVPRDVQELWQEGFRPLITVVGNNDSTFSDVEEWRSRRAVGGSAAVLGWETFRFCLDLTTAYEQARSGDRLVIRVRTLRGETKPLDITGLDDPQHPLLSRYELIQDGDLRPLSPEDLTITDVEGFFRDPANSWRPYCANMPWPRDDFAWPKLRHLLRRLDKKGPEANAVTFVRSEPGAGGTTLARMLAWTAAAEGYPTLFAHSAPFTPAALEVASFMTRVIEAEKASRSVSDDSRLYETPWLIVFDRDHWEGREIELRQFVRALEHSGRVACVLVVTGPHVGLEFLSNPRFTEIENLTHEVPVASAAKFGEHLNRFLAPHGAVRTLAEWHGFFESSAVHASHGVAAFWVALSFWLQRQIDMTETVQSWIYRQYKTRVNDPEVARAIIDIAAMSTQRRPLPDTMLPPTTDWPVSQKLDDVRSEIGALGLVRLRLDGDRFWALAHNVLGRYLLNALYYDSPARESAGFGEATSPEHLRFLALRRLTGNPAMGLTSNRAIAEEFAVNIFKIDPDRGHATFVMFWSEALDALDAMPQNLWKTSRAFRHHSAISRRRIAKDKELFPISSLERQALLERAIADIRYALENIPKIEGEESDLNLYNSLARAYQDLHDEKAASGASPKELNILRESAQNATLRAFQLNPDSPFVVETYARSLLGEARATPSKVGENAIEVLNLIYSEMERDRSAQRRSELSRLSEAAVELLMANHAEFANSNAPEVNVIVEAVRALTRGVLSLEGLSLCDFPLENRITAEKVLSDPTTRGNLQAVRMLYALRCLNAPKDFMRQLELLESLRLGGYPVGPQHRLELALLLNQCGRYEDAEEHFKQLRQLWRTGDYYAQVPERLRWLMDANGRSRRQVTARVAPSGDGRGFAKVREMRGTSATFRAEEFGQRNIRTGTEIRGYISFGHNGPFLRPLTR